MSRAGTATVQRDSPTVECRVVANDGELAAHLGIRRAVFVDEQGIFAQSDQDVRDAAATTLHVLGLVDGLPAGTVRIFPIDPADPCGDWQGDRLAVLPEFRGKLLGAPLVRYAVATAGELGGRRMIAHVQPANRTFFQRLGWRQVGAPELYVGVPHLLMDIELSAP